jgi:hypothetical protein
VDKEMKNSTQVQAILITLSVTAVLVLSFLLVKNDLHPTSAQLVSYSGLKSLIVGTALLITAFVLRKSPEKREARREIKK